MCALFLKIASRTQETVTVLVKIKSGKVFCKIFEFEYVTYARARFVKAWIDEFNSLLLTNSSDQSRHNGEIKIRNTVGLVVLI